MPEQIRRPAAWEPLEARRLLDGELDTSWMDDGRMTGDESPFLGGGIVSLGVSAFGGWPIGVGETFYGVNDVVGLGDQTTAGSAGPLGQSGPTLHQEDGRHLVAVEGQGIFQYNSGGQLVRRFAGGHLGDVPSGRGSRIREFLLAPDGDVIISGEVGLNLGVAGSEQIDFSGV